MDVRYALFQMFNGLREGFRKKSPSSGGYAANPSLYDEEDADQDKACACSQETCRSLIQPQIRSASQYDDKAQYKGPTPHHHHLLVHIWILHWD